MWDNVTSVEMSVAHKKAKNAFQCAKGKMQLGAWLKSKYTLKAQYRGIAYNGKKKSIKSINIFLSDCTT